MECLKESSLNKISKWKRLQIIDLKNKIILTYKSLRKRSSFDFFL